MSDSKIRLGSMASVILSVSDQDRAIAFYVEKLGMEKRADIPFGNGDRWVEVALPGATVTIALGRPPEGRKPSHGGTCISFTVDDVDRAHAAMKAAGVDIDPEVMRAPPPVPPMFFFRDPDGNPLLAVARM